MSQYVLNVLVISARLQPTTSSLTPYRCITKREPWFCLFTIPTMIYSNKMAVSSKVLTKKRMSKVWFSSVRATCQKLLQWCWNKLSLSRMCWNMDGRAALSLLKCVWLSAPWFYGHLHITSESKCQTTAMQADLIWFDLSLIFWIWGWPLKLWSP